MDVTIAGSSLTQTPTDDQLGRISIQLAAFDGEVGVGSYPIDDAAGTHDFKGDREFVVTENTTVYLVDGFLTDQTRERGSQPAAPHRETVCTVLDANALLYGFRVGRSRGAETDVARVLAFAAADLPTFDTTWVLNSNTSSMTAKKYDTGEGWTDLITDTKELTGKTLFVHDKANGGRCLHYHRLTSGHTCGLVISDVASAVDGITTFAPQHPARERSPADLFNDVKVRDQAGRTYTATDATSITDHDADGMQHQTLIDLEAGSQAELEAKGDQILADSKDERFTYTCAIGPLDFAALLRIRVGDLITTTSAVMGLTATAKRIAHMTLTPFSGKDGRPAPGLWNAELELGAPIRTRRRRSSGKKITDSPPTSVPGSCLGAGDAISSESMIDVTFEQRQGNSVSASGCEWDFSTVADRPAVAGNSINVPGVFGVPPAGGIFRHFISHDAPMGAVYAILEADVYSRRFNDDDSLTTEYAIHQGTWGAATFPPFDTGFHEVPLRQATILSPWPPNVGGDEGYGLPTPVEVTIPVDDGRVQFMFRGSNDTTYDGGDYQTHDVYLVFPGADPNDPDAASYRLTYYAASGCADAVVAGTLISPGTIAHGDGVSDTFITPYAYKSGTLVVFVDGREQAADQTDPENGQFTLPYKPPVDAVIRASFVASSGVPLGAFLADDGVEIVPYGSDIQDVAGTESVGDSRYGARDDHVHRGVTSIQAGVTALYGAVTLSAGTNVTLDQVGQDIEINASGGGGGASGWDDVSTNGVALEAGRIYAYDSDLLGRLILDGGYVALQSSGFEISLQPPTGYVVAIDSGDGLVLPDRSSDPTPYSDGHIYYHNTEKFLRAQLDGTWHNIAWFGPSGTATITSGNTSITVTHGAGFDPISARGVDVWPTNNPTNDPGWFWVSNVGGVSFDINVRANPGASGASFAWRIVPF